MHPWLHFKTITKHKLMVMGYCFRIGLYKQGLLHDLSKYSPAEFLVYKTPPVFLRFFWENSLAFRCNFPTGTV